MHRISIGIYWDRAVKMLNKFPIDPRVWKEKTGWATSNAFEIDVVAVTE